MFLTEQELQRIVDSLPARYPPLTLFLAEPGMRWGEAPALTKSDLVLHATPPTA